MKSEEEMTKTSIAEIQKVEIASTWNGSDEKTDGMYQAFYRLMEQRKKISIRYLRATGEREKEMVKEVFDQYNAEIRKVLGV